MKRPILALIAALLFAASASAQPLLVQDKNYEKFEKISVEDYFVLRFIKADKYAVSLKTDERIAAHVQAYVKNGTLFLNLDEKGYSPELKKQLRERGLVREEFCRRLKTRLLKDFGDTPQGLFLKELL